MQTLLEYLRDEYEKRPDDGSALAEPGGFVAWADAYLKDHPVVETQPQYDGSLRLTLRGIVGRVTAGPAPSPTQERPTLSFGIIGGNQGGTLETGTEIKI